MKKNFKVLSKIIISMLVALILISMLSNVKGDSNPNLEVNQFNGQSQTTKVDNLFNNTAVTVVAVLRIVSIAIAMIMLLVIAMKYMMSAPGDRADIKKHAVAYVIGAVILFSATQIIALLIELASNFSGTENSES